MATQNQIQPWKIGSNIHREADFRGGPEGGANGTNAWLEAASQSWGIGDLLYLASGKLTLCGVNGSNQLNTAIAGQAKKPAAAVTDSDVHFSIIRGDDEFMMNVYHSTPAAAITARTQLGSVFAVIKIGGKWMVDIENAVEGSNNALGRVLVTDIPRRTSDGQTNTVGDIYGLVIAQFIPLSLSLTGTLAAQRTLQLDF